MRIAQITDLHMRHHQPGASAANDRRSRIMSTLLPQALGQAAAMDIDLLAVTGDLLDAPDWVDRPLYGFVYDDPRPWCEAAVADYRLIKQQLDDSGMRYVVLPGNHDDETAMWQVFDETDNVIDIAGHRVVRFCDRDSEGNTPRRYTPQRDLWETMLADTAGPPQIHLQHYVIAPPLMHGWPHSYAEGDDIANRNNAAGHVRLCLSGHYHDGTGLFKFSNTTFATGRAFCISPFPWRVYDVDDNAITVTDHQLGRDAEPRKPVVFLDRDGVINDLPSYRTGAELMNLVPGSAKAIARLRQSGFAVVVITGQSAVGYGYVPASVMYAVNDKMCRLLAEQGAHLDGLYALTGGREHSVLAQDRSRSTSKTEAIHRAFDELNLDPAGAWMVGDRMADVRAALAAPGVTPVLVRTGGGAQCENECRTASPGVHVADDLAAAVEHILSSGGTGTT